MAEKGENKETGHRLVSSGMRKARRGADEHVAESRVTSVECVVSTISVVVIFYVFIIVRANEVRGAVGSQRRERK